MGVTQRQFKSKKRQQLKEVERALDEYRLGCAGSPAYPYIHELENALHAMIDAQSVKNWGR